MEFSHALKVVAFREAGVSPLPVEQVPSVIRSVFWPRAGNWWCFQVVKTAQSRGRTERTLLAQEAWGLAADARAEHGVQAKQDRHGKTALTYEYLLPQ
jgi:hypothetical protein